MRGCPSPSPNARLPLAASKTGLSVEIDSPNGLVASGPVFHVKRRGIHKMPLAAGIQRSGMGPGDGSMFVEWRRKLERVMPD